MNHRNRTIGIPSRRAGFKRANMRHSPSPPPFRIGRSKTGLGLFATVAIRKGAFIAEYWGRRIPTKTADDLNTKYLFEINSRWTIDGSDRRNLARYINHSCRPNAEPDIRNRTIRIRAVKNIEPGDEITYHYGNGYFETFIKPFGCKCAACARKHRRARSKRTRA
jgi:SET domain-containing protein